MVNFTVGPVQMDSETRLLGVEQMPYFRTSEFSKIMLENEKLLCSFLDAPKNSRVCFLTSSGTGAMEAAVLNFFTYNDRVLVINGGIFGKRFKKLCDIYEIPNTEVILSAGEKLTKEKLYHYDALGYTGLLIQLCETSTGVKYDIDMVGEFCKRNKIFLVVDAISGFIADEFSMKDSNTQVALTGSQKALSLPPGVSFLVISSEGQERLKTNPVRSMYFNIAYYLKDGERGQTPFTPAVSVLLQLNEKLKRIDRLGGIKVERDKIISHCTYFRRKVTALPLRLFIDKTCASNCVTVLQPSNENKSAYKIYEILKEEFGIWVCPNGGELREKIFRVGHVGNVNKQEIDILIDAFHELNKRGKL